MILKIDTKDMKVITVSLKEDGPPKASLAKGGEVITSLSEENEYGSQVLLPLIMKVIESKNLKLEDLTGIEVETGPGSYTGLRVGASVANALGFTLGIPVNGKQMETQMVY